MFVLGASKARTPPCGGAHLADVRMAVVTIRYSERPELWQWSSDLSSPVWPEYNLHGDVTNRYWARLYDDFPTSSSCYISRPTRPRRPGERPVVGRERSARWASRDAGCERAGGPSLYSSAACVAELR